MPVNLLKDLALSLSGKSSSMQVINQILWVIIDLVIVGISLHLVAVNRTFLMIQIEAMILIEIVRKIIEIIAAVISEAMIIVLEIIKEIEMNTMMTITTAVMMKTTIIMITTVITKVVVIIAIIIIEITIIVVMITI